jgi:hypothetical protein
MKRIISLIVIFLIGLMIVGCSGEKMPEKPNSPGMVESDGLSTVGQAIANIADYSSWAISAITFETNIVNDGGQIVLTINGNDDLILENFYIWNEGTLSWDLYKFDGDAIQGWLRGDIEKELIISDTIPDENGEIFVVGYSCSEIDGDYDCHTSGRWQMTIPRVGIPNVAGASCILNQDCINSMHCNVASCLAETGTCADVPETCNSVVDKVCGCDGVTYDNSCLAAQAKVSVSYEGSCLPEIPQGYGTNDENCPGKNSDTKCVTVSLFTSKGRPLEGAEVTYYMSNEWKSFETTDATGKTHMEMDEDTYRFRITYDGSYVEAQESSLGEMYVDISDFNKLVEFKTREVIVRLEDSFGNSRDDGKVEYNSDGFKEMGFTDEGYASVELLPEEYRFKVTYDGTSVEAGESSAGEMYVDIKENPMITFQTQSVTVVIKDSGNKLLEGVLVEYHSDGWKEMGFTNANGEATVELLPEEYRFRVTHEGTSVEAGESSAGEMYVDIKENPEIEFVLG